MPRGERWVWAIAQEFKNLVLKTADLENGITPSLIGVKLVEISTRGKKMYHNAIKYNNYIYSVDMVRFNLEFRCKIVLKTVL